MKNSPDQFGDEESRKRFEAALKGARLAGHKPMESLAKKKKTAKRRAAKKALAPSKRS